MHKYLFAPLIAAGSFLVAFSAQPVLAAEFPKDPDWTTVLTTGQDVGGIDVGKMEGLTGDDNGVFYVADRGELDGGADPDNLDTCHVWRINTNTDTVDLVGQIALDPCRPSGLTFDANGDLFITTSVGDGFIYKLTPDDVSPMAGSALGSVYVTNVPGANGVAFVGDVLYVTDGTKNLGRVWRIGPGGGDCDPGSLDNCVELFRIQPRRNGTDLGGEVDINEDGVGSVRFTVPRFDVCFPGDNADTDTNCLNRQRDKQDIVANGIAFTPNGKTAYVSDTARGAIWAAKLKSNGDLVSEKGCNPTFHENVLCMDSLYVAHPLLEGADGIALLDNGTILVSVNERNAIVAIAPNKTVTDAFQNEADADLLRNGNDSDQKPLEFPTSPFISGKTFCTTNADSGRRDNNPSGAGVGSKVNCIVEDVKPGGLSLPVQ